MSNSYNIYVCIYALYLYYVYLILSVCILYICRCGVKKLGDKEKKYVHMLNATLCATGRAICCLLETYQDVDGVHIPEVLIPYMGGITFLPFIRASRAGDTAAAVTTSVPKPLTDSTPVAPTPAATAKPAATTATAVTSTTTTSKSTPAPAAAVKPPTPPAAATTTTATTASVLPPAVQAIVDKITAKGDEIRILKAAKVSNSRFRYRFRYRYIINIVIVQAVVYSILYLSICLIISIFS